MPICAVDLMLTPEACAADLVVVAYDAVAAVFWCAWPSYATEKMTMVS